MITRSERIMTEVKLARPYIPGIVKRPSTSRSGLKGMARFESCDIAPVVLLAALVVITLTTYKDYSISNDEGVQHHYGELIITYYTSDFKNQSLFSFQNLYLYGGLFDIIAVALAHLAPIDPYDLRHMLSALIGIAVH